MNVGRCTSVGYSLTFKWHKNICQLIIWIINLSEHVKHVQKSLKADEDFSM